MKRLLVSCLLVCLFSSSAIAQQGRTSLPIALKGYDVVAYFTENGARVGDARYQYPWDGSLYRFASEKHLAMFRADPERYLPQYNNWCAASVAKGEKVHSNPEYWLVVDNKLYLFGKPTGPRDMKADPAAMKRGADRNWPDVAKLPAPLKSGS